MLVFKSNLYFFDRVRRGSDHSVVQSQPKSLFRRQVSVDYFRSEGIALTQSCENVLSVGRKVVFFANGNDVIFADELFLAVIADNTAFAGCSLLLGKDKINKSAVVPSIRTTGVFGE